MCGDYFLGGGDVVVYVYGFVGGEYVLVMCFVGEVVFVCGIGVGGV